MKIHPYMDLKTLRRLMGRDSDMQDARYMRNAMINLCGEGGDTDNFSTEEWNDFIDIAQNPDGHASATDEQYR